MLSTLGSAQDWAALSPAPVLLCSASGCRVLQNLHSIVVPAGLRAAALTAAEKGRAGAVTSLSPPHQPRALNPAVHRRC